MATASTYAVLTIILVISVWKSLSNGCLLLCIVINRRQAWPSFAANIAYLTLSSFLQGIVGVFAASVGFVASENGVSSNLCMYTIIAMYASITYEELQVFYIFIQRFLAFFPRRRRIKKRRITFVNICLMMLAALSILIPLVVWKDPDVAYIPACSVSMFHDNALVMGYVSSVMGIPATLSILLLITLHVQYKIYTKSTIMNVLRRKSTHMKPLQKSIQGAVRYDNTKEENTVTITGLGSPARLSEITIETDIVNTAGSVSPSTERISCPTPSREGQDTNIKGSKSETSRRAQQPTSASEYGNSAYRNASSKKSLLRALKVMTMVCMLNVVLPLQYMVICLLGWLGPDNLMGRYAYSISFLLLYLDGVVTSLVFIKNYSIIRVAVLKMLKAVCTCDPSQGY